MDRSIRHNTLVRQQGLQLSIPIVIAKAFNLENYNRNDVLLRKLPSPLPSTHCADHVELFFRDQHLGRGEMWRMTAMMVDSCAWVGREVTLGTLKVKTKVGRVYIKGKRVLSGHVTPYTKLIFRSESAKYHLFIQISSEMWTFEEDGSLYHEKAILFLEDLFSRWASIGTSHLVSIILFCRVLYSNNEKDDVPSPVLISDDGEAYKDFYKVIVDLEPFTRPQKIIEEVREEISKFQKHVLTYIDCNGTRKMAGKLSYAPEGNILEAMGLACNLFDEHYIDRDLRRTGVSIVFVTAGTCVYHVDQMLLRLITERFIAHGVGVDFVSLAKIPLHVVPLFRFLAIDLEPNGMSSRPSSFAIDPSLNPIYIDPPSSQVPKSVHYSVPFFVDCSFFSRHQDRPFRIDRFMPRCRMPEFQNGIGEHDLTGISIPLLSESMPVSAIGDDVVARKKARQRFDAQVVDASPTPLAPLRSTGINQRSGSRAMVDGLAVTAVETKRKSSSTKHEEPNRSPLLKATLPQGATDFSHLANPPSAGLSIVPISSSETSRARAASASTTGSNNGKPGTSALIARLTNLSQQHRPFWPWSSSGHSNAIKTDTSLQAPSSNRLPSPSEGSRSSRHEEANPPSASHEPSLSGPSEGKTDGGRVSRSDTIRSATALMPMMNASRRTVSTSSDRAEVALINSRPPSIAARKLKPRLVVKKFNPSNPCGSASGLLSQFRKWSSIFPRSPNDQRSLKWKSLTTPACLPITTNFAPSQEELSNSYSLTEYEFPIGDSSILIKSPDSSFSVEESMRNRAALALREAVSQRLVQGFQLVMPEVPQHVADLAPSSRPLKFSLLGIIKEAEKGQNTNIDLSLSDHYHRLSIRRLESGSPTLSVQIYVRYQNWKAESFLYRPAIWWSNEMPGWYECKIKFNFPLQDSFDFKALDRIIVGIDKGIPLNESLNYYRLRAVFLPTQTNILTQSASKQQPEGSGVPSDDEDRLAGMMKLQSTLRNVSWQVPYDSTLSGPTLDFTTSDASQHVRHECERSMAFASTCRDQRDKTSQTLNLRDPLPVIAEAMLHPSSGVEVKSQLIQLRPVENVFLGDKFVTFLKNQFNFGTREEALKFGRQLETRGMFKEFANGHQPRPLIDGNRYYQLNQEYRPAKPPRTWFGGRTSDKWSVAGANLKPISNPVVGSSNEENKRSSSGSRTQGERIWANMTRIGIIDLDPTGKSDRSEKAILHCDISHSPSNAWHVEIQWLGITSSLVDSLLQHWSRIVERYGIKMVEQSTRSLDQLSDYYPLQRTIQVDLALKPPPLDDFEDLVPISTSPNYYLEGQLLRSLGFVLDVEADENFPNDVNVAYSYRRHPFPYSQFIHHTGAAVVQIRNGRFVWADNLLARISANRRFLGGRSEPDPTEVDRLQLRRTLVKVCNDPNQLKAFWDQCIDKLRQGRIPPEEQSC